MDKDKNKRKANVIRSVLRLSKKVATVYVISPTEGALIRALCKNPLEVPLEEVDPVLVEKHKEWFNNWDKNCSEKKLRLYLDISGFRELFVKCAMYKCIPQESKEAPSTTLEECLRDCGLKGDLSNYMRISENVHRKLENNFEEETLADQKIREMPRDLQTEENILRHYDAQSENCVYYSDEEMIFPSDLNRLPYDEEERAPNLFTMFPIEDTLIRDETTSTQMFASAIPSNFSIKHEEEMDSLSFCGDRGYLTSTRCESTVNYCFSSDIPSFNDGFDANPVCDSALMDDSAPSAFQGEIPTNIGRPDYNKLVENLVGSVGPFLDEAGYESALNPYDYGEMDM
mmetsp:Transcript_32354/g.36697  ORF Transcript_32354/g.36697 Transcript_32354/m.36697 type:complete len:343 (-) Transcript_32354:165-1193(-)